MFCNCFLNLKAKIMYTEIKQKFRELEEQLSQPEINKDIKRLSQISKEHSYYKKLVDLISELERVEKSIEENQKIIKEEEEGEIVDIAQAEILSLEEQQKKIKEELNSELYPDDPNDKRNVIMEIRAGTGGDESALFAGELFRMYSRYAEKRSWEIKIWDSNQADIGGFKEVTFLIKGENVYKELKFEGGTHRVQRVPETEKSGRIHTSAATVAVLPEAEDVEVEIKESDLRIDTYSASGPGGQSVNTSNSAVRITHEPTGLTAQCQDEKSQQQNKERAMQILRARILSKIKEEEKKSEEEKRKSQVGSGDRSEKIRTYNYPQDRLTDHRIKQSWNNLEGILDGNIEDIIKSLQKAARNSE